MERQPVTSSHLVSIGYDEEKQILEVEFQKGAVYQYQEVPKHIYNDMMAAESIGSYFMKSVKPRFACVKM